MNGEDVEGIRQDRRERAAQVMEEHHLDSLLLTGFDNIRYVTDYRVQLISEGFDWFAAIVDRDGRTSVLVPYVDEPVSVGAGGIDELVPVPSWAPLYAHPETWCRTIAGILARSGARRVGYDGASSQAIDGLRSRLERVALVDVAMPLLRARMLKSPAEIRLLEDASIVNSRAVDAAIASAKPGVVDYEILATAMATLQGAGVEYLTHSLCNAMNDRVWFASGRELRSGDAFFLDIGCYCGGGYASDMARTGFVDEPARNYAKPYKALLDAHEAVQEIANPGVSASRLDRVARDVLEAAGCPRTPYGIGHGVGLRACELPTLSRAEAMDDDLVLEAGMVIAIEPETAVLVDGNLVVLKVEDVFAVEAHGLRRLTTARY
jgi:Xaa-Pro dipeptidase